MKTSNNDNTVIAVLGSSGSVGTQALDVARNLNIKVDAVTGGRNVKLLEEQIREFSPRFCAMADENAAIELKTRISDTNCKILSGACGIEQVIAETSAKTVVNSILGLAGLAPTLAAARLSKRIAIANKESLVAAGDIVNRAVAENGAELVPVDSEHSAVFQCLACGRRQEVKNIILTASGGPFYGYTRDELKTVTKADALKHPTWTMGAKITIDSATMMNKGLEVIEAVRLFGVKPSNIRVVIHRESIIHSAVEYIDNAVIAELSHPDMRECVQYAITYPKRTNAVIEPLDLFSVGTLTFQKPDTDTFPLLATAYRAIEKGGAAPAVMSAANEAAVDMFLNDRIGFTEISDVVGETMSIVGDRPCNSVEDVYSADKAARIVAYSLRKQ